MAQKFHHVKDHGMIPILCVGETLSERENGKTEQVIAQQVLAVSAKGKDCFRDCVVAYELYGQLGQEKLLHLNRHKKYTSLLEIWLEK